MKNFFVYCLIVWGAVAAIIAYGGTYTRQADSTIVDGLKIEASDLNSEFDAIKDAVNAIDTTNVTDGSLTDDDYAATSTAVTANKKYGCAMTRSASQSVQVLRPCEIFMDGVRSVLTATQTITLTSDLDTGSGAAATFYHVYGVDNSGDITFQFSTTEPDFVNARKNGDTTRRYVGTVRTEDNVVDIIDFEQDGNFFRWKFDTDLPPGTPPDGNAITGLQVNATQTDASADATFTIPTFWEHVHLQYEAFATSFPAQCTFEFDQNETLMYQAVVVATGTNAHVGRLPFNVPVNSSGVVDNYNVRRVDGCDSGRITVRGWVEPKHFHQ